MPIDLTQIETGEKFELLCEDLLKAMGFIVVENVSRGPDRGKDIIASKLVADDLGFTRTHRFLVECKHHAKGGKSVLEREIGSPIGRMSDHREEQTADYALLIAPAFSGGKLADHAVKNIVAMLTTDVLVSILKRHDQFPFSIAELRRLFERKGLADGIDRELGRLHHRHHEYIELAATVLHIFDQLQRQQETSEPITGTAIYLLLLSQAQQQEIASPDRRQIDEILELLSNPVLDILDKENGGYVLTLPPSAARKRLEALAGLLSTEE